MSRSSHLPSSPGYLSDDELTRLDALIDEPELEPLPSRDPQADTAPPSGANDPSQADAAPQAVAKQEQVARDLVSELDGVLWSLRSHTMNVGSGASFAELIETRTMAALGVKNR